MMPLKRCLPRLPELVMLVLVGILSLPLLAYVVAAHLLDYKILKNRYMKSRKWDLNICCGDTDCGGINADIGKRAVPNFVLVKSIYKLPFRDKAFKNALCSHTMEHVEDPDAFMKELRRVSRNVTVLIPPLWDIAGIGYFRAHKWQFLTFKTKHVNVLPEKIRLPYWRYQEIFGQDIFS